VTRNSYNDPPVSSGDDRTSEDANRAFDGLRPELVRFAFWLSRDRSIAEDVVQEALLRAWRSRGELKDPAALRPWLLTIVRREHARLYERKRVEVRDVEQVSESLRTGDGDEALDALRLAILRLPDAYREPLVMQVFGGFTAEEIGAELSLSTGAVLTRLCRARQKLREIYGVAAGPPGSGLSRQPR
jgi:RNA polymerase sigma-70 factor (ECF subfamily)